MLLLDCRHVRLAIGGLFETNTEFVLLQNPQPHQLSGDVLQGVQLAPLARLLVHLPFSSVARESSRRPEWPAALAAPSLVVAAWAIEVGLDAGDVPALRSAD